MLLSVLTAEVPPCACKCTPWPIKLHMFHSDQDRAKIFAIKGIYVTVKIKSPPKVTLTTRPQGAYLAAIGAKFNKKCGGSATHAFSIVQTQQSSLRAAT